MPIERWIYVLRQRLDAIFHGRRLDQDLDEELREHIEQQTQANVGGGMSLAAARTAAFRSMGGVQQRKEEARAMRGLGVVEDVVGDVRCAARTLRRAPGFSVPAVLVLALAIGTSTAMFSIAHGVLLKPLPFPDADRLVLLSSANYPASFGRPVGLNESQYLDFRRNNQLFEGVASFAGGSVNLTGVGEPVRLGIARVTTSYFPTLGVTPMLGRTFGPGEDQAGRDRVVILSERLWRIQFAGAADILGARITLDGTSHEVIGVIADGAIPSGLSFPNPDAQVWTPFAVRTTPGQSLYRPAIGRLKRDVGFEQARAELEAHTRPAEPTAPDTRPWRTEILPLKILLIGDAHRPLAIFSGVVAFVLLVACASVANLYLVRTASKRRELLVRAALGASRGRLVRQLLVESLLLSLAGGAAGALLAYWGVPALRALAPAGLIPRAEAVEVDRVVLVFTFLLSAAAGVLTALAPALITTGSNRVLTAARTTTIRHRRLSSALIVAEIALTLVLTTGAALLLGSFLRLRAVDSGFRPDGVMTMSVQLPSASYRTLARIQDFHTQALARLREDPGISSVGGVNWLPFGPELLRGDFALEDARPLPNNYQADKVSVSPGYFRAMGIRMLQGRDFSEQDRGDSPGVVVISQSVARDVWPGENVLGRRIAPWKGEWLTIVGVVDDVKQQGPAGAGHPALYQPYAQMTRPMFLTAMTFVAKGTRDAAGMAMSMRAAVRAIDREHPVVSIAPMDDLLARQTALPRFQARVIGALALFAVMLTVVGVYGVLSYVVAEQRREIAVRMALGATVTAVWRTVVIRAAVMTSIGAAIGLVGALALTGLLEQFLFELSPTDPVTFGAVTTLIVATALAAACLPAWRAARVDPAEALRAE